jgi:hypothetical protein
MVSSPSAVRMTSTVVARSPSQVMISAGSVKCGNTTSGGAAMRVVAVTGGDGGTALSRFLGRVGTFDGVLEAGERVRPELGEQGPHRSSASGRSV